MNLFSRSLNELPWNELCDYDELMTNENSDSHSERDI